MHLWFGQLLIPVDRANQAGPFFMVPWNYPGLYRVGNTYVPVTPAEGRFGRSTGGVLWGEVMDGHAKYYAGIFNLTDITQSPLYSGRVSAAAGAPRRLSAPRRRGTTSRSSTRTCSPSSSSANAPSPPARPRLFYRGPAQRQSSRWCTKRPRG